MPIAALLEAIVLPAQPAKEIVSGQSGVQNGVTFYDETGINPLPPGILVTFYPSGAAQTAANIVAQGYTQIGGFVAFDGMQDVNYVATFYGRQGP